MIGSARLLSIFILVVFYGCTKKKGTKVNETNTTVKCEFQSNQIVSYSSSVSKIISQSCLPCHAAPGAGGINLDNYQSTRQFALNGELLSVVSNYDPDEVMMPPPPRRHLDSCQIKALQLWVTQGCLNN